MKETLIDVFKNIELEEEDKMECLKCKTTMENDDFYQNEEGKYFNIWICPKCGKRIDTSEDDVYN